MSEFGMSFFAVIILAGIVAVVTNDRAVRRWVVALYLLLMAFIAFGFFVAGVRPAVSALERMGGTWSTEAAAGAVAMHSVDKIYAGMLLVMALFLVVLVFRRPK